MSYAIFAISQLIGIIVMFIAMGQGGTDTDETVAVGGKIMLGGAMLACCVKYLFS